MSKSSTRRQSPSTRPAHQAGKDSAAEPLPDVDLYTDGACSGNPGPGGWAFILRHPASGKEMEESGGESLTTNNRMELLAVIKGLEALKRRSHVELYTDSEYVRQGLAQWMPKWKANDWRRKVGPNGKTGEVKNLELWKELDELVARHDVKFNRVAGHSDHPENDRCDQAAVAAYQKYLRHR
jgi:ribonuclease HI